MQACWKLTEMIFRGTVCMDDIIVNEDCFNDLFMLTIQLSNGKNQVCLDLYYCEK